MTKIWLICRYTYTRRVRSGSFVSLTLIVLGVLLIAGAIPFIQSVFEERSSGMLPPVGLVDKTGELSPIAPIAAAPGAGRDDASDTPYLNATFYPDEAAARAAMDAGEITGFLVVPEAYREGRGQVVYHGEDEPGERMDEAVASYLRRAYTPDAEPWVWARLDDPGEMIHVVTTRNLVVREGAGLIMRFLLPVLLALMFAFLIFTGANQMGPVIVQEKEKRALEMVITSISPRQLVAGKLLGMTLLSLTQIGVWGLGALAALLMAFIGAVDFGGLSIPWSALIWGIVLGIPGYFLFAVLAAGLGIIAGSSRQAEQLAGVLGLFAIAPLWLAGVLIMAPEGRATVGLSLFPLTAPAVVPLRMALVDVPAWQLVASLALMVLCLAGAIWLVARLFRAAMLMYGQTLHPRQIWQALRQA